jgi:hypothetical protein
MKNDSLCKRFDLTQPWDSPVNKPLLNEMPPLLGEGTETNLCWVKSDITQFADITNGMSNTIAFVQSDKSVPWTQNNDVTPAEVMEQFQDLKPGESLIATFYDGSVRCIPAETPPDELLKMLFPRMDD